MNLRSIRIWLWVAVVALGLTAITAAALLRQPGQAGFGKGVYSLVDQNGQPVDQSMLVGHPSALFFGFTHCPDVCPTTMAEMSSWFESLGDQGKDLRAYFVTIDPERDTPQILGDYVSWVSDRITGVTGTPEEIAKIAKAWGIYYQKVPLDGGGYTMDHTASVFLVDRQGEFQGTIAYGESQATALEKLRNLLAKS
ncbi:SCO family protein [Devosia aquimaris]|uniref:SCO family protein n=1 Tax=Devosia aquimaris TaxID=2866214 RepID=UPI00296537D9|nr:SCO family protein [Devosia sp. CJK-A8-3]